MSELDLQQVSLDDALGFLNTSEGSCDFLGVADDCTLLELLNSPTNSRLGSETVRFSDQVLLFSKTKKKKPSERELVVTDKGIYIFKEDQRKKPERKLDLIAVSSLLVRAGSSDVLVRTHSGPDMLLQVVRSDEFVTVIEDSFEKETGSELRVGRPRSSSLHGLANFERGEIEIPRSPVGRSSTHSTMLAAQSPTSAQQAKKSMEVFEGWLAMQNPSNAWRRRWCVANDSHLTYYEPAKRSQGSITEGAIKRIGSELAELMGVLDTTEDCHKLMQFMHSHQYSMDEALCYLDIKAFERCESGSREQMRFVELIDAKYIDQGSDHALPVSDEHVRLVDSLIRSGMTQSDSLTELKVFVLEKLQEDAFPKYQQKHAKRRRRSFFDKDEDLIELPKGLFAFTYTPKKGKPLVLAAENELDAMRWVQKFEDTLHSLQVGRSCETLQIEGWLHVRGSDKKWVLTYCVLDGDKFWQYDMKYKGSISLSGGRVQSNQVDLETAGSATPTLDSTAAVQGGFRTRSRFAFRFNMTTKAGMMYCFAADGHNHLLEWLRQAQRRIDLADDSQFMTGFRVGRKVLQAMGQTPPKGEVACVFTDVQSSTDLWEQNATAMEMGLKEHDAVLRGLIGQFNGYEVKTEGDAFMVTFHTPLDAVQWCAAVQKALVEVKWPEALLTHPSASVVASKDDPSASIFAGIRVRMGVHWGQPNCRENPITHRMDYFGNPINKTARMSDSAHGGQILATAQVVDYLDQHEDDVDQAEHKVSVKSLGKFRYKGIKDKVSVFSVAPKGVLAERAFPRLRVEAEPEFADDDEDM